MTSVEKWEFCRTELEGDGWKATGNVFKVIHLDHQTSMKYNNVLSLDSSYNEKHIVIMFFVIINI